MGHRGHHHHHHHHSLGHALGGAAAQIITTVAHNATHPHHNNHIPLPPNHHHQRHHNPLPPNPPHHNPTPLPPNYPIPPAPLPSNHHHNYPPHPPMSNHHIHHNHTPQLMSFDMACADHTFDHTHCYHTHGFCNHNLHRGHPTFQRSSYVEGMIAYDRADYQSAKYHFAKVDGLNWANSLYYLAKINIHHLEDLPAACTQLNQLWGNQHHLNCAILNDVQNLVLNLANAVLTHCQRAYELGSTVENKDSRSLKVDLDYLKDTLTLIVDSTELMRIYNLSGNEMYDSLLNYSGLIQPQIEKLPNYIQVQEFHEAQERLRVEEQRRIERELYLLQEQQRLAEIKSAQNKRLKQIAEVQLDRIRKPSLLFFCYGKRTNKKINAIENALEACKDPNNNDSDVAINNLLGSLKMKRSNWHWECLGGRARSWDAVDEPIRNRYKKR